MVDLERYGWDDTPTPDMGLDESKAPQVIQKLAQYVIDKRKGKDVASAYSQALIAGGVLALEANTLSKETAVFLTDMIQELTGKEISSGPEIVQMRDGEPTANDRLVRDYNHISYELHSAKGQLLEKVGGGKKAELEDLSANVLSAIQDGGETSFNVLSIPQDKSVDNAKLKSDLKRDIYKNINGYIPDKKVGINKFNPDEAIYGGYYNQNGTWASNAQVASTDFISINPGQTVRYLQTEQISAVITFWNGMGEFVKGAGITSSSIPVGTAANYPAPEGVKYFKVSVWIPTIEEQMVTVDDPMPSSYVEYEYTQPSLKIARDKLSEFGVPTSYDNLTPGDTFDFNNTAISGYGYGYSSGKNIVNAPENRNVNNAFYYWSYLHESGVNKFINQFYIDAMTGEMWLRNSLIRPTGELSKLSGWVKVGGDEREAKYQKIQGIGDSIMYGLPDTGSGRLAKPWISQIASYFKSDVINLGINSSTIATNSSGDNPSFGNGNRNPIVERLGALDTSADLTILEGGINDFWIGIPLGDFDSRNTDTFYGALHAYYGGVAEMLNDKKVIVMTCLQSTTSNPNGVSLYDWTRAQVEVANHYSLPVFDAYSEAGIAPRVSSQKTKYMNDGLHLSQAGADRFAESFISYL